MTTLPPDLQCPLCGGSVVFYRDEPDVRCQGCGAQWDCDGKGLWAPPLGADAKEAST